ncbi:MAG TPA: BamA/TamA family outer membrane protein [Candidatus Marinimicrobia bacterium]|jgi:outer membrane protein assembly factor BamA|nr:BamA/TamA family outer membrane protein [Candidatus Neomarinimicrobiota bacterium]MDP6261709.1 BamA/TamA family outer membrane protein [Candidatus Neomarinimicrobiota bacterium]MDP7126021.1 BamA/TamA family outer membrane protein [Candidatus Neomarinimicrobiota bacterium]MDP7336833.1 BamA/TamA family outer membrane protein [Candidatus Neomarinimicrobiota bacterium]MDP7475419.1 BamA/TamA family outer membrane protein [Candidatus Neomarinimicrobiota bacterium]|tara:strand:- start:1323 stop:2618 length:1296 start_codon:yes stop_codon:yes gene_type:complete
MKFPLIQLTLSLFFLVTIIFGQDPLVSEIQIIGNEVTKKYVILREIQHPTGVLLDSTIAVADRNRIENLGIYSLVGWQAVPLENGTVRLKYNVIESSRFFPVLAPSYEEDTGWSIVFGGVVKNVRGRNESLTIGGLIGGVDAYGFDFNNPWIFGDHVSLSLGVGKHFSNHVFLPYERQVSSFEINIGRYFGYQKRISVGFEYEKKDFIGDSTTSKYYYFAPQGSFAFDTRDIYNDPSKGIYIYHFAQYFKYFNIKGNSLFWTQSYSAYASPIKGERKTTLGANLTLNSTHGDLYEEMFLYGLGGGYSVRGWKIETRKLYEQGRQPYRFGFYSAVSSLEFRQTVIPRFSIEQPTLFGPVKSELGLQAVLFIDGGVAGDNWNDLSKASPMYGTGLGIRMPVALAGNIRLDYGWSFYKGKAVESSFHFSVGQKF